MSHPVRVDEALWSAVMAPEGILERWFQPDGAQIQIGQVLAEVSIEGARHEIVAPIAGRLQIILPASALVEPGSVIGQVS